MLWKRRQAANSLMTTDVHFVFTMDRSQLFPGKEHKLHIKSLIPVYLLDSLFIKNLLIRTDETLIVLYLSDTCRIGYVPLSAVTENVVQITN